MYGSKSFVKEVGRSGVIELYKKGYDINQIANIYDASASTVCSALRALYGRQWKHTLEEKRNEYESQEMEYLYNEEHMLCAVI